MLVSHSINSDSEQRNLEEHIQSFGMGHEHFWTSGTDQGEESKFFWMSTGKPMTYENWNAGEPNNFQYENGEQEHCLELSNRDGKGLRWNDTPCSFETFFVCEVLEKHCDNTRVMMKKFKRGAGERRKWGRSPFFGRLPSDWNFTSSCENILVKLYLFLMFFVSRVRPQNNRKTC